MGQPCIEFEFELGGKVNMEVKGVPGKACLDLTKPFEQAFSGDIQSRQETAEMKQPATTSNRIQQGRRQ